MTGTAPTVRGLPGEAYTSAEVFAWERDRFWRRGWVCLGRARELPEAGCQSAVEVAGENILVVRDDDGGIRAYVNACRHRGHELVEQGCTAHRRTIWCAYHAWVYKLDGSLRNAPGFTSLDGDDLSLLPVRSAVWHGWIFVNPSGDAGPLSGTVGNLGTYLDAYRPEDLSSVATRTYEVAADWKLIVENYLECYHCPSVHPELSKVQRTAGGEDFPAEGSWFGGSLDLRNTATSMSLDGSGTEWTFPRLHPERARQVCYHGLLPGLFVTALHDYVVTHRLVPLGPGRTRVVCDWLFPQELLDRNTDPSYAVDFWETTNAQDWAACESVQRGVSHPRYVPGPLAPHESALRAFLARLADAYRQNPPLPSLGPAR